MSYERSDGGSGGIGALEPMAGLYDDCGCGCLGLGALAPTQASRTLYSPPTLCPNGYEPYWSPTVDEDLRCLDRGCYTHAMRLGSRPGPRRFCCPTRRYGDVRTV